MDIYKGILLGALAVWLPCHDWDGVYKMIHPDTITVNHVHYRHKAGAEAISVTWPDGSVHSAPAVNGIVTWEEVK